MASFKGLFSAAVWHAAASMWTHRQAAVSHALFQRPIETVWYLATELSRRCLKQTYLRLPCCLQPYIGKINNQKLHGDGTECNTYVYAARCMLFR